MPTLKNTIFLQQSRDGSVLYSCSLVPVEVILYGKETVLTAAYGRSDADIIPPLLLSLIQRSGAGGSLLDCQPQQKQTCPVNDLSAPWKSDKESGPLLQLI